MVRTFKLVTGILVSLTLFIGIFLPLFIVKPAYANSHPWADVYGFWYSDGYDSEHAQWGYSSWHGDHRWFSGIETLFKFDNPSVHYGLCYRGWSSTYYYNAPASTPYGYLPGDAYFYFSGHANSHLLGYIGNWLSDVPRSGDSNCYYVSNLRNMDDMKFAMLGGCRTAANDYGDGRHLAWEFRCDRGVDTVVGFTRNITWQAGSYYPAHCWDQEFSRASQIYQYHVADSCAWAKLWVYRHCGNNHRGFDTVTIWGNGYNYIYTPGDGIGEGRP
ncbi:MAG: hypothetical protein HPY75_06100 [Actinobacteria bacterium]|nr:hypothetical protein [Actinomycetota bacterium]